MPAAAIYAPARRLLPDLLSGPRPKKVACPWPRPSAQCSNDNTHYIIIIFGRWAFKLLTPLEGHFYIRTAAVLKSTDRTLLRAFVQGEAADI